MKTNKSRLKNSNEKPKKMLNEPLVDVKLSALAVLRRIFAYMRPYSPLIVLSLLCSLIQVAATLAVPVIIGRAIDSLVVPHASAIHAVNFDDLLKCLFALAVCIVLVIIFSWLGTVFSNKLSFYTVRDMRYDAFKKLNKVPLAYIDSNSHGDIISRIVNDADQVSDGLIQGFSQSFIGIITIIGTLVFMLTLNPLMTLIVVLVSPLSFFAAWFLAKSAHNMFKQRNIALGELSGLCNEMITNQSVVKAFNREQAAEESFDKINNSLKKAGTNAMFYSSLAGPVTRFVNGIVYASVATAGALTVLNNPLFTIGSLSSFLFYANQYTKPFNEITGVVSELQSAFAAARRVISVLDEEEEADDSALPALVVESGKLKANSVSFSYSPAKPLIKNFNIDIKSGWRVAIVGPTGCGKTTFINLLMRFYDVTGGTITIDGTNIMDVTRSSLRTNFGMVLQDSWLFKGTIKENIAYGKENATDEEIIEAAKKAHIHSFIMRTDNGYDTIISENGGNISQGQKQLLCIARIMLTQPPMLILDEATSSIDTLTEKHIQSAFSKIMKGRTSFIIAHRLSTIVDADIILVMNNGDIIESGTHGQLLQKGGFYHNLYKSQFDTQY